MKTVPQTNNSGSRNVTLRVAFKEIRWTSRNATFLLIFDAVLTWPPITVKSSYSGEVIYTGLAMDLLNELSWKLGISFQLIEYEDESWGKFVNGTWTGLLGLLYRKEVDLIAPLYINEEDRNKHFDMSYPVIFDQPTIGVYLKPAAERTILEIGVAMFSWEVLLLTFISLLLTALVLTFDAVVINREDDRSCCIRVIFNGTMIHLFHLGGNLLKQGSTGLDKRMNRFVYTAWWLFCLIISSVFIATLIASLSTVKPRIPFTSTKELVDQDTYAWGFQEDGYIYFYAQRSKKNSAWFKLWGGTERFLQNDPDVRSTFVEQRMRKVKEGNYVYVTYRAAVSTELRSDCNLTFFDAGLRSSITSLMLWKGSPLKPIFSEEIVHLHENGFIEKLMRKWITQKRHCAKQQALGYGLDLVKLAIVFQLLMIGLCLAVSLLILEMLWKRFNHKKMSIDLC